MRRGRLWGLGLLVSGVVSGVALTGCTHATVVTPRAERANAAVPSYAPPPGAPGFCSLLADTTHLTELPAALGTLAVNAEDVEAGLRLSAAIDELQDVADHVPARSEYQAVGAAVERLVSDLHRARDTRVTDDVRAAITGDLDDVGSESQPLCGFPT